MAKRFQTRRLEGVDENIWVELVGLADKYKTVNLGQGFPDFDPPCYIKEAFAKAITEEHTLLNQYTRAFVTSLPGMWERTITIGSAGKTFSATGWKVGWALGPDHLLKHLRTLHQNSVYHCATGAQEAVAQGLQKELERLGQSDCYFIQLRNELQKKRDRLYRCLTEVGMKPVLSQGSYFMIADISHFKSEVPPPPDNTVPYDNYFVKWMMKNKRLAAIPVSAFYSAPHKKEFENYIRFCFVKEDTTLDAAEKILQKWSKKLNEQKEP
uniref:Aminotransferase class I/classII large domain-containing protein n=1 Tax=Pyxicephalus adspersus TaxID=30357 RepID=A0AAV3A1P5_PYXAD|nr:TPA: hypothetical protein GDO54_018066 [Pyxicephalus adspersus]DBA21430.1 TPA: hypothetical protein GDO54_018066 [Pyxicephalus adspersus]